MNRVVKILMKRDEISESDAIELIEETRELILNSDPFESDDIIADNLGLEPDYLMEILGY